MKRLRGIVCASMLALSALVSQLAMAASGTEVHPLYALSWSNPKEVLIYRSCGCADACWTATVKDKKTGAVKATLKRNCDRLAYALGRRPLQALTMPLEPFDSENKNQKIKQTLERILGR
jgi:hypothetical protein